MKKNNKKKIIFIVLDGLSDRPIKQLNQQTPLAKAKTPHLDFLAEKGICGLIYPFMLKDQKKPESDTCHLALFGYNPDIFYLNRGPYEAIGAGLKLKKGDVALRANFSTVRDGKVIDRRAGRIEKTEALIRALKKIKIKGAEIILKKSYGHRLVIVLRGKNIYPEIESNDPKQDGLKVREIKARKKRARLTAYLLNQFLAQAGPVLSAHRLNRQRVSRGHLPANYILLRGAGRFEEVPGFKQKYGLKACCLAGGALYKGIAQALGMKVIRVKGATGLPNTDLRAKFLAVKKNLKQYDFIFLHIKAADSLAEDGDFWGKTKFIEKIDRHIKNLAGLKNTLIVLTGDHSTCSEMKKHCPELIPFLIFGSKQDKVKKFSEKACANGDLKKIKQADLMAKVLRLANRNPD